ncbi:hypothetical protein ACOKQT_17960 [Vibrio cholerae]|uniref:hypothetical protein n=1 Tax=Vibrio cholerae TaxID=666 RepID=UPI002046A310|nr:hypothetical protein 1992IndM4_0795 [Vibrio phage ICP1]
MNQRQAVKFWNEIVKGEVIGWIPDTQQYQGGELTKPTYLSTICDQLDLPKLGIPYYGYAHPEYYTAAWQNPNSEQNINKVVSFLRELADSIEGKNV